MIERPQYYRLVGKDIEPLADVLEWAMWRDKNRDICRIAFDRGHDEDGTTPVDVSTVFLGLDHRFSGTGDPLVFETMIFGGTRGGEMWRYSSFDDAVAGHDAACEIALKRSSVLNWEYLET